MTMIEPILGELEQESAATMRLLERVPEGQLSWRPHAKSMSLGQLALHVAQVPGLLTQMAQLDGIEAPQFQQAEATSRQQLIDAYQTGLSAARSGLSKMTDAQLMQPWHVRKGAQVLMSMPRIGLLRALMLNHLYHHRGQLTVYLRMLDVPLPSVYGPTADERPF
ncbi:MAG: DinB family protein [Bryobacteraceae bacterium]